MLIGITGKSGSGKSFLAQKLVEKINNSIWIDIDKIGHMSLNDEKIKNSLIEHFGSDIIMDNLVNRKKLSNIVFNNKNELNFLNNLTEKYIKNKIKQVIADNKDKIIILDWALLGETEFLNLCDIKILVKASQDIRAERIINRDKVNIEKFNAREKASYNYDETNFDFVLENNEQLDLTKVVSKVYEKSYISG